MATLLGPVSAVTVSMQRVPTIAKPRPLRPGDLLTLECVLTIEVGALISAQRRRRYRKRGIRSGWQAPRRAKERLTPTRDRWTYAKDAP